MNECRDDRWFLRACPLGQAFPAAVALLILLHASRGFGQTSSDPSSQLTLAQFRSLVATRLSEAARASSKSRDPQPPVDLRPADKVFAQLLVIQARDAAAHQSVDRLSGWSKAIQVRYQTQNAPELDVDAIRFAEGKRTAESARMEAEQKRLVEQANSLLGRAANAPLLALLPEAADDAPDAAGQQQKDLLSVGEELLSKLYQSYQFGGIPLSALLWQEQELYRAELNYRVSMAHQTVGSLAPASSAK